MSWTLWISQRLRKTTFFTLVVFLPWLFARNIIELTRLILQSILTMITTETNNTKSAFFSPFAINTYNTIARPPSASFTFPPLPCPLPTPNLIRKHISFLRNFHNFPLFLFLRFPLLLLFLFFFIFLLTYRNIYRTYLSIFYSLICLWSIKILRNWQQCVNLLWRVSWARRPHAFFLQELF